MEVYKYKGIGNDGKFRVGKIDAINIADLEMRLHKIGLDLISAKILGKTSKRIRTSGVNRRDLILLFFHLEQTTKAGIPILESLHDISESTENHKLRDVIIAMHESIVGGQTLSEAMAAYPRVFHPVFVSLVVAGEESGEMSNIFFQLGESIKWKDEQIALTKKLLMYPLFVGIVVGGVIFFLMIYLVPQLLVFISNAGQEIPIHTRALFFVSNIFVNYWYFIISVPILSLIALLVGINMSKNIQHAVDGFKLKLPIFGAIYKKIILARLVNIFAIMYASGVTIIDCINAAESVVGNKAMQKAVHNVGLQITDGYTLSKSFEFSKLFPPLVLRMIRIGESTGELEVALLNIHYFYTRDVKESIENLQNMIEPGMTVVLGTIVAWVMFSVLGPIYDLISTIKV